MRATRPPSTTSRGHQRVGHQAAWHHLLGHTHLASSSPWRTGQAAACLPAGLLTSDPVRAQAKACHPVRAVRGDERTAWGAGLPLRPSTPQWRKVFPPRNEEATPPATPLQPSKFLGKARAPRPALGVKPEPACPARRLQPLPVLPAHLLWSVRQPRLLVL